MIKGVNKRVVEITGTEHEFFEKAVLYIRADKSCLSSEKITEEAREYLSRIVPVRHSVHLSFAVRLAIASAVVFALIAVICIAACVL